MLTHIHTLRTRCAQAWKKHGHFLSAMLCGLLFGALFGSYVDLYQAASEQETVIVTESVAPLMAVVPLGSRVETLTFVVSVDGFTIPSIRDFVPVKLTRSVTQDFPITVSEESTVSSFVSSTRITASRPPRTPLSQQESIVSSSIESSEALQSSATVPAEPEPEEAGSTQNSDFPAFDRTVWPVSRVPNWGAMRTPAEWDRSYGEMTADDFVSIPKYDASVQTKPMSSLVSPITEETIPQITAKLFYSTDYMGDYDVDSGEYSGSHAGVDLKLALGTPVGSIAGGRVSAVKQNAALGNYVVIEHRIGDQQFFSTYAHLGSVSVEVGAVVKPGTTIGYVGMTGNTSGPHLHLEVKRGGGLHGAAGAGEESVHPLRFISTGGKL